WDSKFACTCMQATLHTRLPPAKIEITPFRRNNTLHISNRLAWYFASLESETSNQLPLLISTTTNFSDSNIPCHDTL
ncbi:hypothetical protein MJO28_007846, partial [Puccinia striiformis f. sp. tritici]